jgi:hypothetical protein
MAISAAQSRIQEDIKRIKAEQIEQSRAKYAAIGAKPISEAPRTIEEAAREINRKIASRGGSQYVEVWEGKTGKELVTKTPQYVDDLGQGISAAPEAVEPSRAEQERQKKIEENRKRLSIGSSNEREIKPLESVRTPGQMAERRLFPSLAVRADRQKSPVSFTLETRESIKQKESEPSFLGKAARFALSPIDTEKVPLIGKQLSRTEDIIDLSVSSAIIQEKRMGLFKGLLELPFPDNKISQEAITANQKDLFINYKDTIKTPLTYPLAGSIKLATGLFKAGTISLFGKGIGTGASMLGDATLLSVYGGTEAAQVLRGQKTLGASVGEGLGYGTAMAITPDLTPLTIKGGKKVIEIYEPLAASKKGMIGSRKAIIRAGVMTKAEIRQRKSFRFNPEYQKPRFVKEWGGQAIRKEIPADFRGKIQKWYEIRSLPRKETLGITLTKRGPVTLESGYKGFRAEAKIEIPVPSRKIKDIYKFKKQGRPSDELPGPDVPAMLIAYRNSARKYTAPKPKIDIKLPPGANGQSMVLLNKKTRLPSIKPKITKGGVKVYYRPQFSPRDFGPSSQASDVIYGGYMPEPSIREVPKPPITTTGGGNSEIASPGRLLPGWTGSGLKGRTSSGFKGMNDRIIDVYPQTGRKEIQLPKPILDLGISLRPNTGQGNDERNALLFENRPVIGFKLGQSSAQRQSQAQGQIQALLPKTSLIPTMKPMLPINRPQTSTFKSPDIRINPMPRPIPRVPEQIIRIRPRPDPKPEPGRVVPPPSINFGFDFSKSMGKMFGKIESKSEYRPSIEALLFNVRGSQPKVITPFSIRPITGGRFR